MLRSILLWIIIVFGGQIILAQSTLHIVSEPDVVIYMDGKVAGFTSLKKGGLHLDNIEPGKHKITLYKLRHIIQDDSILVAEGNGNMYYASPFVLNENEISNNYLISQANPKGKLKIQSVPVGIVVEIPQLGLSSKKVEDKFMVSNIVEGQYEIHFIWNTKQVSYPVSIMEGKETHIFVNMLKNLVTDKSLGADSRPQVAKAKTLSTLKTNQDNTSIALR